MDNIIAHYHLPGLFEYYDLYKEFLPLYRDHKEYFYEWCDIASIYGAPADCLWGGGRVGFGDYGADEVISLMNEYAISPRLTFSNSLIREEHLSDRKCNDLCKLFSSDSNIASGVIIYSDLLLDYIRASYRDLYYVSSTTKVLTKFEELVRELDKDDFQYVVADFRLNKKIDELNSLSVIQKNKVELLCNECCDFGCNSRKQCYENVSRKNLGESCEDYHCKAPLGSQGYRFSLAMDNPGFIGVDDIVNIYLPIGISNYKIEGRGLGSAIILEFLLYYMVKPNYQLKVREEIYLDSMLDLF